MHSQPSLEDKEKVEYTECPACGKISVLGGKCLECDAVLPEDVRTQKHYTQFVIQPMEFIGRNKLGFLEGNVIKYVCRYQMKNGLVDLRKAQHYLEKLIEREEKGTITL